ncbi:hypothetical protein TCAL_11363 [Tigriopus californicus]|uniref:Cuticle protein 6 n=1 Tax=Tigriopus californicus TaxID=6832 RepID=A0A553PQM4_TIGCA|nr:uncharacterized protein LOC131882437 [Tigriopus californicus]TRY79988.1 hypothetical protein TCAL_11363 [Tigriopus californicus]|eukprot:TCALIF_11363-PA protein Name:"Similar to Cuticle protein 6 (Blaberus craniifer)" AED:0.00 eAED:0.00 QI:117/1/1/1/1/1/2/106/301
MKLIILSVLLVGSQVWAESNPDSSADADSAPDAQYTNLLSHAVNAYASADELINSPVNTQYHAQSELGEYSYGFDNPLSSKQEVKTADGVVQGSYSYASPDGRLITNNYISDDYGFRSSLAPSNGEDNGYGPGLLDLPDSPVGYSPIADIAPEIVAAYDQPQRYAPAQPALRVHPAVPDHVSVTSPGFEEQPHIPVGPDNYGPVAHEALPSGYAGSPQALPQLPTGTLHYSAHIEPVAPVVSKSAYSGYPFSRNTYRRTFPNQGYQYHRSHPFRQHGYSRPSYYSGNGYNNYNGYSSRYYH